MVTLNTKRDAFTILNLTAMRLNGSRLNDTKISINI